MICTMVHIYEIDNKEAYHEEKWTHQAPTIKQ